MARSILLNLVTIASLALLTAILLAPLHAHALSLDNHNLVRTPHAHGHDLVAIKKRSPKRCKASISTTSHTTTSTSHTSKTPAPSHGSSGGSGMPKSGGGSGGGQGGRGKVGLAWPNGPTDLANFVTNDVSFIYTWGPDIPSNAKSLGLKPMPMLWGDRQIDRFKQVVVEGYANIVLGVNEPNEPGQSNMSPEHGAYLWKTYIQPLKDKGYFLVSPATSSNPNGLVWMKNFFNACDGCTFDAIATHWYDVGSQKFIDYINLWHNTFHLPIYVTEFACQNFNGGAQCSQGEVDDFLRTVTHYMDNADWVLGYFAFGLMRDMQGVNPDNQLMNWNGQPNSLGWEYIHDFP